MMDQMGLQLHQMVVSVSLHREVELIPVIKVHLGKCGYYSLKTVGLA